MEFAKVKGNNKHDMVVEMKRFETFKEAVQHYNRSNDIYPVMYPSEFLKVGYRKKEFGVNVPKVKVKDYYGNVVEMSVWIIGVDCIERKRLEEIEEEKKKSEAL